MTKTDKALWDYATVVFSIPQMRLEVVSKTLGIDNIKAIMSSASGQLKEVNKDITDINWDIKETNKTKSQLLIDEAKARNAENILKRRNMSALIELLKRLRFETKKRSFVLPELRDPNYFSIGDEVMIYVSGKEGFKKATKYDWVSGKILCPNLSGPTRCITNNKLENARFCHGHFFQTFNQDDIFKRSDFYKIRKMLKEGKNDVQIKMMHQNLAKQISEGTVEPLTDKQLASNQKKYIQHLAKVVSVYKSHIPVIAKRYGVKI
jgi:hypothetical protein